ncbi:MAG: pyridoxamine 5'-phosphate oxidase family protein [Spirochaetales bacterium]|nr:pyridoxamine 5'-phosphate oxidase family protein [Spirochaetales bacterium]
MAILPEKVIKAWDLHEGPPVFVTVKKDGTPNAIYATCVSRYDKETFLVANNYFSKTMDNISSGSKGSLLFITKEGDSYQVKGTVEYYQDGAYFENMKTWNPVKHPGHGVAVIRVEEVYSGAEKLSPDNTVK